MIMFFSNSAPSDFQMPTLPPLFDPIERDRIAQHRHADLADENAGPGIKESLRVRAASGGKPSNPAYFFHFAQGSELPGTVALE